jgi:pyruvate/2-oxoglutarate dehydrogenase complex dihydrolipoamide dehydrogenase (E3) component
MFDVIVLGGGPAGVTAALRARELGAQVALVERGVLGGTCTNDGCVPTRVLAKAARLMRDTESYAQYGLTGERPTLDFARLLGRTQDIIYGIHEKKQLLDHLGDAGVEVFTKSGSASFIDAHRLKLSASDDVLEGDKFIICVGGHARRLPFPGAELTLTHSDVWSLQKLPRRVAVVGAAATGCQLASIFNDFGSEVTLLELAPRILPGEDSAVSAVVAESFRRHGQQVLTGIGGVESITQANGTLHLHYKHDDAVQTLEVDAVVLAVGWPGNIEALQLENAGVKTERGYVQVDDALRSSAPNIYAAGDITGRMMLVQSASLDARIAAENAVLGSSESYQHRIVPHGGFTDPEYGSVGLTEEQARAQEAVHVAVVQYDETDRAIIDGHTEGLCKLIVSQKTQQVIGAHVVGEQALEVIQMVAAGMASGITVQTLANLELAYPTYAAIVGLAARRILRDTGAAEPAAQWRNLSRRVTVEWERRGRD